MSSSSKRQEILESLITQIRLMSASAVMHSQAVADRSGIHTTDMECIDFLLLKGPASAGQIAEMAGLTTGAVTAMIDRLENAGLVKRQHDTTDRRRILVIPILEKIAAQIIPHFMPLRDAFITMSDEFSEQELEIATRFLECFTATQSQVILELRKHQ